MKDAQYRSKLANELMMYHMKVGLLRGEGDRVGRGGELVYCARRWKMLIAVWPLWSKSLHKPFTNVSAGSKVFKKFAAHMGVDPSNNLHTWTSSPYFEWVVQDNQLGIIFISRENSLTHKSEILHVVLQGFCLYFVLGRRRRIGRRYYEKESSAKTRELPSRIFKIHLLTKGNTRC